MSAEHDIDVISLVFGVLFVGAALFWGLVDQNDLPGRGWYLPVLLIAVGLIGLLGSLTRRGAPEPEPIDPEYPALPR